MDGSIVFSTPRYYPGWLAKAMLERVKRGEYVGF